MVAAHSARQAVNPLPHFDTSRRAIDSTPEKTR
jgi:hypothetical protein